MSNETQWLLLFDSIQELEATLIVNKAGKVQVDEDWFCLLFDGENLYAFEEECPHQNYSLLGAACIRGKIICPLHKFQFNLETGQGHGLSLSTYPVKKQEGKFYIGIQKKHIW